MTKSTFQSRVRAIVAQSAKTAIKTSKTATITVTVLFPDASINELAGNLFNELGAVTPTPAPTPAPPSPPPTPQPTATLYRAPQQVDQFVVQYPELARVAAQPTCVWLGAWSGEPEAAVGTITDAARVKAQTPLLTVYMIPGRDMGGFSAGGAKGPDAYKSWIDATVRGIHTPSMIVLEPDAIVQDPNPDRYALITYATTKLMATGSKVYIDAGHPRWYPAPETATRLYDAGVEHATGFALNTSNFVTTDACHTYAQSIIQELATLGVTGVHYLIDTSRNGNPELPETWDWANPANRWLGPNPTTLTGHTACDAYLYVKAPGESDGWGGYTLPPQASLYQK